MKKFVLFSAMALSFAVSQAQTTFGIQAGANFASLKSDDGDDEQTTDTKVGFIVGGVAEIDFGNSISFRPELNFIQKGGKSDETETAGGFTTTAKGKATYSYIQLSPNFVYNFSAGTGKVFLGLGPEFSFGVGGKEKYEISITGTGVNESETEEADVKFDGKEDATDDKSHYKAFDYGANVLAGYKLSNGAFISAGYTLGLGNLIPGGNDDFKYQNRGFHVKIGFMFGGKSAE